MSVTSESKQDIFEILRSLEGLEPLKELFWERLGYDRVSKPLSRQGWSGTAKNALAEDPVLWASGGEDGAFQIIYARLAFDRLLLGKERPVVTSLLREHPYSLFVFSNEAQNRWHFVNVRVAGADEADNRNPLRRRLFRRITVGPEERLRTAAERIAMLDLESIQPDLLGLSPLAIQQRHDEAFDVEAVTRLFYDDYEAVFKILQTDLREQAGDRIWAHDYALQFLNRCMFIYFVQRKRWLGVDPDFFNSFWKAYEKSDQPPDTFYERWLKVLFFEAFNNKFHGGHRHFPKEIADALQSAPYLNGGLFQENPLDEQYDGKASISDERFLQIISFLQRYNFTIREDTPLDKEVAVDSEMLGKVYESLVNLSEETHKRGDAGIFYTPRTEIDMMCRLALVDHLANHLGQDRKSLLYEAVFAYSQDEKDDADTRLSQENLWNDLDTLLQKITVVDPACGSGSFLVGMLQVLDDLIQRASALLGRPETPHKRRRRIIGQSLYGVDVMHWAVEVAELRLWLQLVIETELKPEELTLTPLLPNLSFKVRCGDSLVQELGGINLAHLKGRQDIPRALKGRLTHLRGEKLNYYYNEKSSTFRDKEDIEREERRLFRDILQTRCHDLSERLKRTRRALEVSSHDLLGEKVASVDASQKRRAEAEEATLQAELDQSDRALSALKKANNVPFVWDIAFVEIFDGERRGFDIVIGNPPYVRQESIASPLLHREQITIENKREYKAKLIRSVYSAYPRYFGGNPDKPTHKLSAKSDLYIYFFFHGLKLLNENGSFCFITSNSWLDVGYGKDLQEFLLTQGHVKMVIDNKARRSFASADVNTAIALLALPETQRSRPDDRVARFVMFSLPFDQILSPVIFDEIESATKRKTTPEYRLFPIRQGKLFKDGCEQPDDQEDEEQEEAPRRSRKAHGPLIKVARYVGNKWGGKYLRAPDIYWTILKKGEGKLVRLGDVAEVRFGIKTGANEFFFLDADRIRQWGIEEEFLKLVIKSPRECKRILINPKDLKFKIFMCHKEKSELRGMAALEYIKWGESQRFDRRPSCRGRASWWSVVFREANGLFVKEANDTAAVFYNPIGIPIDCRLYCANLNWTTFLFLNSPIAAMMFEIFNRAGLGEGARSLMVSDYMALPCLSHGIAESRGREIIQSASRLRPRKLLNPENSDWSALDDAVSGILQLSTTEREAVYEAVIDLCQSRLKKADSFKKR